MTILTVVVLAAVFATSNACAKKLATTAGVGCLAVAFEVTDTIKPSLKGVLIVDVQMA